MKSFIHKFLCVAFSLFCLTSVFGQGPKSPKDQLSNIIKNENVIPTNIDSLEKLNIYNLLELSKYITSPGLTMSTKKELYNRLMGLVGTDSLKLSKLDANENLRDLIRDVQANDKVNMETLVNQSIKDSIPFEKYIESLKIPEFRVKELKNNYQKIFKQIDSITIHTNKKNNIRESIGKYNETLNNIYKLTISINEQKDLNADTLTKNWQQIINDLSTIFNADTIKSIQNTLNFIKQTGDTTKLKFVNYLNDKITKYAYLEKQSKRITNIDREIDSIRIVKEAIIQGFTNKILEHNQLNPNSIAMYKTPENLTTEQVTQQIQINSIIQSAEQSTKSSFSLPSESDLINALAIFLANRAKREALIWFMDKLKERINDPIVIDAFPLTTQFIYEQPSEALTDFNASLRRAMAEDFIKLPEHIINSPWINQHYFKETNLNSTKELIKIGSELLSLVHAQYTYRDIIKHFNLNTPDTDKNNTHLFFNFLYMMTNEFFTIDMVNNTPKYRLLAYEELSNITLSQWDVFKTLLPMKYDLKAYELLTTKYDYKDNLGKIETLKNQLKSISSLLLTLSQFDKLANRSEKIDPNDFTSPSLWNNLLKVVENVSDNFAKNDSYKRNLEILKKTITIYDHVYNKNFDQVVKNSLVFLKNNIAESDVLISITPDSININSSNAKTIKISLKNKFNLKPDTLKINKKEISLGSNIKFDFDSLKTELKYINYYVHNYKELQKTENYFKTKLKLTYKILIHLFNNNELNYINDDQLKLVQLIIQSKENPLEIFNNPLFNDFKFYNNKLKEDPFNNLLSLATFFTDITNSTDSKSLAAAIDKNVLPPTSYINKRKANFSIDLNGYVGVYGGFQKNINNDSTKYKQCANYGITAPIGINFNWKSFGIFLKAIDIGNLVSQYLWASEPENKNDDINFRQVINPGIYGMWNIPKSPFVLYGGASTVLGEDLKTKNDRLNLLHISGGIKIDIPMINLTRK